MLFVSCYSATTGKKKEDAKPAAVSSSDAVLNCPACFSVLCLDCQRHEAYKHQYRAMFVMNCVIDHSEKLTYPKTTEKKKKGKKSKTDDEDLKELFHPVKCSKCSTQVAVFDDEEIYHFFNVIASHS